MTTGMLLCQVAAGAVVIADMELSSICINKLLLGFVLRGEPHALWSQEAGWSHPGRPVPSS